MPIAGVSNTRASRSKRATPNRPASASFKGCRTHRDFRELLADRSIDAVFIGAPDHWHVPMSMAAIGAGKDVSLRKAHHALDRRGPRAERPGDRAAAACFATTASCDRSTIITGGGTGSQRPDRQGADDTVGRAARHRPGWMPAAARDARPPGAGLRALARPGRARRTPRSGSQAPGLRAARMDAALELLRRHDHQLGAPTLTTWRSGAGHRPHGAGGSGSAGDLPACR